MKTVHEEQIEWLAETEVLPADDSVVLVFDQDDVVSTAFFDRGLWRGVDAFPLPAVPKFWAPMPKGPKP